MGLGEFRLIGLFALRYFGRLFRVYACTVMLTWATRHIQASVSVSVLLYASPRPSIFASVQFST